MLVHRYASPISVNAYERECRWVLKLTDLMSTTSNSTYHKNINFEEFFPIFSVHKAKHHSSDLRVTFTQIFCSIRECHVVFFINSSKVRVKFRGSRGLPESSGLRRVVGGEGWSGAGGSRTGVQGG